MVGCLGGNFADTHHFISGNADWILKSVDVPLLEKGDVKTYVRWVEVAVLDYFVEEAGEVFDVVHGDLYLVMKLLLLLLSMLLTTTLLLLQVL